nr:receptor tyrosine kinase PVR2A2 [Gecarcinus lateralis]
MKLLPLLLLLSWKGCASSTSGPPQLDVGDELLIEEYEPITLTCTGSKPLRWKTPIEEEYYTVTGTSYVSTFSVSESFVLDTGYYYCHYEGVKAFENDKENVDSTYVYVYGKNGNTPFVKHSLHEETVSVAETLVVDCTVTHPNIKVTLLHNTRDITNEERVSFNPRKGFSVKNVRESDAGTYKCKTDKGHELGKKVIVSAMEQIRKPSIRAGKNQHYVKGDNFSLECMLIDPENITFSWSYPNPKAKHIQEHDNITHTNTSHLRSILKVNNASENDTGNYTCSVSTPGNIPNRVSVHITIKEKLAPFVNITSSSYIIIDEGEPLFWSAEVLYYPYDPVIKYTNWKGLELKETDRLTTELNETEGQSWLRIKNITNSDFGNYTITVTTGEGAASDSSTIQIVVNSIPHMKLTGVPLFLAEGRSLNITCLAAGYPKANVSLHFQDCSNGSDSCSSSLNAIQTGMEKTSFPDPGNIVEKSVTFSPHTSGLLWCAGQNEHGSGNTTAEVRISDIGGVFVLHHQGENRTTEVGEHEESIFIVENDQFSLMCGGSKFDYKSVYLTHTSPDSSNTSILQADGSRFSWRARKTVEKATKVLAGKYNCIAEPHRDQQLHIKRVTILVVDEEEVHFGEESNLKNQTVVMPEKTTFYLSCSVTGMPEPTILWLKDGKPLTHTSGFDKTPVNFSKDSKVLSFKYVFKEHEGVYTCVAKNRLNEVRGSLTISVEAPGLSHAAKVGLAIAFVSIAMLIIVVVFLVTRVKKEKQFKRSLRANKDYLFKEGNVDQLNPNCTTDQQANLLPYDPKWEVPRKYITFGKLLGSGAFGRVIKATVTGLEGPATTTVAIKMCRSDLDVSQLRALTLELKIMIHLGKHLNIVNLMGANTVYIDKGELWILNEYCRFGNLLDFMHRHRRKFVNQVDAATGKINFEKTTMDPVSPSSFSSCTSPIPAPVDTDGYLAPSSPQFILSDPPRGHFAKSAHPSTVSSNNSPASESTLHSIPGVNHAHNPLYCMGVSTSPAGPKEGTEGNEGFSKSHTSQGRDSTHLTPGPNILSNTTSDSLQPGSPGTNMTTLTRQTSSPLSPTDSCFMGEAHLDTKGNAFTYEVGSVPGVTASFSTSDLISWGWQVAKGMEYLSRRNVLHGDLAARNLLLSDNNVVKISDFGMSRDIYKDNVYVKSKDALMPVKWMSVEAIRDRIFTVQSDVWAFGITLWEIFSLGTTPYPSVDYTNFLELLEEGYRMDCPKYANQEIHNIMMQCWKLDPMDRPPFSQLVDSLGLMMPPYLQEEYLSMNDTYMRMNEERFKEETDYLNMMANPNFESLTKAEEPGDPQYVNVQDQTHNSNSVKIQCPSTDIYYPEEGLPSSPTSLCESNYLPMKCSRDLESSSGDVFSPSQHEPARIPFPNFNERARLSSLLEEEETCLIEPKRSSVTSTCKSMRTEPPSEGDTSSHKKGDTPVAENRNTDTGYVNVQCMS